MHPYRLTENFGPLELLKDEKKENGNNLTPFQAVTTALAGTVGTGNIAGVAAAIVGKPKIIFFDEATSALDTISEHYVQEAINNLSKQKTIITIAHRLSTIKNCDKIIVMDKGFVKEIGTHAELIAKEGIYYQLCKLQKLD